MDHQNFAKRIIQLKAADLALRDELLQKGQLGNGYHEEMEQLHNENAEKLSAIIVVIGYPTIDRVGKEASEAAWLVIQHAISQPAFMKKCAMLLAQAVNEGKAAPINLAYLTDRIAVFEEQPQLYGTQFDWNENGQLVPNRFDDLRKVNQRRKAIGLNTIAAQTALMQQRMSNENQRAPEDFIQRKIEMEAWKKKVGWIK